MSFTVIAIVGNAGLAGSVATEEEVPAAHAALLETARSLFRSYWQWDRNIEGKTPKWPQAAALHRIPVIEFKRSGEQPVEVDYSKVPDWVQTEAAKVRGVKEVVRAMSDNSPNGDGYTYKANLSYLEGDEWVNEKVFINNPGASKPWENAAPSSAPDEEPF